GLAGPRKRVPSYAFMSASLIGRLGQALSGYPPLQCRCRSRARASLRTRHQGPSIMGFEDEVEQSNGRPCRECNGRLKRTYDLTSSIVPRGTSFHRWVELDFLLSHLILQDLKPLWLPWSTGTPCRQPTCGA